MAKFGFVIDVSKCIGCDVCVMACKDQFIGNGYPPYNAAQPDAGHLWMNVRQTVRGAFPKVKTTFMPAPCMMCNNAPCKKHAAGGAIYTRPDGIVLIDPALSVGQSQLTSVCPYGRIYWNADLNIPQKCTLCAHKIDQGTQPVCATACSMGAILFGDFADPLSPVSQAVAAGAVPLHPEYGTQPTTLYLNLPGTFLSGFATSYKTKERVIAATVTLTLANGTTLSTATDDLGNFNFDGLQAGTFLRLKVTKTGYYDKSLFVYLDKDKNVGELVLFLK